MRLSRPAVNAGPQKTGWPSPHPFTPPGDLTEAPLSDLAVSRTRRKTQLVRPPVAGLHFTRIKVPLCFGRKSIPVPLKYSLF